MIAGLGARRTILVFFFLARHRIDPAEPTVEVDVGAALRAKWSEFLHGRLAADRAGLGAGDVGALGHAIHLVTGDRVSRASSAHLPSVCVAAARTNCRTEQNP